MARSRRNYRSRRPDANYVWQPYTYRAQLAVTAGGEDSNYSVAIGNLIPGIGESDPFDDDHVLERIRGSMAHNGSTRGGVAGANQWFPLSFGGVRVPKGLTENAIDLFDPETADDFLWRYDTVCNAVTNVAAVPNWHAVDSKAKRKFSVGDKVIWLVSLQRPRTTAFTVDIVMNLRLLWKLKV